MKTDKKKNGLGNLCIDNKVRNLLHYFLISFFTMMMVRWSHFSTHTSHHHLLMWQHLDIFRLKNFFKFKLSSPLASVLVRFHLILQSHFFFLNPVISNFSNFRHFKCYWINFKKKLKRKKSFSFGWSCHGNRVPQFSSPIY